MTSLLLVGCGKMGSALLTRWVTSATGIKHFTVIEPNNPPAHIASNVSCFASLDALPDTAHPDVIVFAVKPQSLADILPHYQTRFTRNNPLYLSIAAGKNLAFFTQHLGEHARIVRAMPNIPGTIGQGMTVLCARATFPETSRHLATVLMQAAGHALWIDDETQMDAVTAISGSGPAYVFYFLDALTKAGIAAGLPQAVAKTLAIETFAGSAALARTSHDSLEQLRKNVTSPGGTTQAALAILMQNGMLEELIKDAVLAAKKRSRELSE